MLEFNKKNIIIFKLISLVILLFLFFNPIFPKEKDISLDKKK
tara:strand:- start:1296 stop:1421 length:126 start_codon:yes stop_codon:yes gene_type:complete